jgi:hypothetical protein
VGGFSHWRLCEPSSACNTINRGALSRPQFSLGMHAWWKWRISCAGRSGPIDQANRTISEGNNHALPQWSTVWRAANTPRVITQPTKNRRPLIGAPFRKTCKTSNGSRVALRQNKRSRHYIPRRVLGSTLATAAKSWQRPEWQAQHDGRQLPIGTYSAQLGAGSDAGIALIELYDADAGSPSARLINAAGRNQAGDGRQCSHR